jgi:hypothetical protein
MLARAARTAKTKLWLCGRLTCRMLPGSRTRDVICKAAPFAVSRWRVTLGKRVPAVSPRDTATAGPVH